MNKLLLIPCLLLLFSCTEKEPKKQANSPFCRDLEEIIADGKLIALTDESSSSYFVYKGTPIGFEYDLLSRFAKELGVQLEMKVVEDMDCVIEMLENGEGDLIAANYTITDQRKPWVNFSMPILKTHQVLIQNRQLSESKPHLIKDLMEIDGDTIYVRRESSFFPKLESEVTKSACPYYIKPIANKSTEALIAEVARGNINYTVADENVARLNKAYHPNIDISTIISDTQHIAWAVRKNSTELLDSLNEWVRVFQKGRAFRAIHLKYFKARTAHKHKVMSRFSSINGTMVSEYDELLKEESKRIDWDWRLLAALIKKESNFNPMATSGSGAAGLMQLIPNTAAHFGADSVYHPEQNIQAGVSYLSTVIGRWDDQITDSLELIKFTLASYNVGVAHVQDAQRLAEKYKRNPQKWEDVSHYLLQLSEPEFYNDPVVQYGYCRGVEPINHVEKVLSYGDHYQQGFER